MAEPESLGSIIARGKVPGPRGKKQRLELLRVNWEHISGERLAAHTRPSRMVRGTLTVAADSPAWAAETTMMTEKIKFGVAAIMGEDSVKRIRVQSRARAGRDARDETPALEESGPGDTTGIDGKIGEEIGEFKDEGMRRALERLVRASKSTKQSDRSAERGEMPPT